MRSSLFLLAAAAASASLLVDFKASDDPSNIGKLQLQGDGPSPIKSDADLGDGEDASYIKQGNDPDGQAALHFHRDPAHRRAEIKAKGEYSAGKKYFIGYEFRLSNIHEHLSIFQWYV